MPLSPDDPSAGPETYALRRLSPFLGVTQFVEYGPARAVSTDGRDWQLQVSVHAPRSRWGSLDPAGDQRRTVAYGVWSQVDGLARLPLDPAIDAAAAHSAAAPLLQELPRAQLQIPFALADRFELWLLDADGKPLALLASRSDPDHLPSPRRPAWRATARGDLSFQMPGAAVGGAVASAARDQVETLVANAAGKRARTQWFQRKPQFQALAARGSAAGERNIPGPKDFPELPVRGTWPDPEQQQLIDAFIDWQAPLLLMLPSLGDATRRRLERAACRQPLTLEAWHRLYPRILNTARINTALVEAKLRRSVGVREHRP
ncbi:MAG: hypothetical protein P8076_13050 [Gammaproteobacteria bacterium]